jgi:HlyD family secretion protein
MDKPRPSQARKKRIKRIVYGTLVLSMGLLITLGLSRLKPAAPRVDRATVYIDSVKRGEMLRQVRGLGKLVPEEIRWIAATTQGLVERIVVLPGVEVTPNTVLVELSNPDLEQSTLDVELQIQAAEADLANLRVQLESNLLNQQAGAANVEGNYTQARLQYEADSELAKEGLIAELPLKLSKVRADQGLEATRLEKMRLDMASKAADAQIAAQQARINQLTALHELRLNNLEKLKVRAGIFGVLQQVPVEVGDQLSPGTRIARVAEPGRLKAELNIAETQAKDIQTGQFASIDTRNGIIEGTVIRIDPAVLSGTVKVDIRLDGELPRGARPDLSVDGTVEIERLDDVLYVGRPAYGQANSLVGIFVLNAEGEAVRRQVRLGRTSVSTMEIVDGLNVGDEVILSDMSAWDAFDRVQLN